MTDTSNNANLAQNAYTAFVQICKGNSDEAGTYEQDEEIVRQALKRLDELEKVAAKPVATAGEIRAAASYLVKKKRLDGDLIPAIEYAVARWGSRSAPPGVTDCLAEIKRMCDIILGSKSFSAELDSLAHSVAHHPDILNAEARKS